MNALTCACLLAGIGEATWLRWVLDDYDSTPWSATRTRRRHARRLRHCLVLIGATILLGALSYLIG